MDRGGQVDGVYMDFEKDFDRVDLFILLKKKSALGIREVLYKIKYHVDGSRSNFIKQGSVLIWGESLVS